MRIGAVSYLNTKPLIYRLAELAPQHELVLDLPSRLADDLAAGRLDVALIPSIEYFHRDDAYQIVSDACIACRGPVRSVKLFSRVEPEKIRTLALDEGSRTSAALVQILLKERVGVRPKLLPFPIEANPEQIEADALLMIGDRAMRPPAGEFAAEWDLGEMWQRLIKAPFVFAMWVANQNSNYLEQQELARILSQARDLGLNNLEEIAKLEHVEVGLSFHDCLTYLRDNLHFTLGNQEILSLTQFSSAAHGLGLAPLITSLSIVHAENKSPGWECYPDLKVAQ